MDISEVVERQTTFRLLALRAHRVADERTIEIVRVTVRLSALHCPLNERERVVSGVRQTRSVSPSTALTLRKLGDGQILHAFHLHLEAVQQIALL